MAASSSATTSSSSNVFPAQVSSGIPRTKWLILSCFVLYTAIYKQFTWMLRDSGSFLNPEHSFCLAQHRNRSGICSRGDLAAFHITCLFAAVYIAYRSIMAWHISKTAHKLIPKTPEGRIFGFLAESEHIIAVNMSFLIWSMLVALPIPELRTSFLIHHGLVSLMCWWGLEYQFVHYYAVYFLGLTEVSTIFLVFLNFSTYFPPPPRSTFDSFTRAMIYPYVIFYALYHVVLWWRVSFQLWRDSINVIKQKSIDNHRPGKKYMLYTFLAMNLVMGFLQSLIFGFVLIFKLLELVPGFGD